MTPHLAAKPITLAEKTLACCVVVLFGLIGLGLLRAAIGELLRVKRRCKRLLRMPGTVLTVVKEQRYRAGSGSGSTSSYEMNYFPFVVFTTPAGERIEFRSELGETHQIRTKHGGAHIPPPPPRWSDGQSIEVFYDPAGEMKPCLATGWALWFHGLGMLAAGFCFFGASVGLALIFTKKLFG